VIWIGNCREQILSGLAALPRLIAALFGPTVNLFPVYVEHAVRITCRSNLILESCHAEEFREIMTPSIIDDFPWMGIEVELRRVLANARLQRALDDVAAHVVSTRVKPGVQQSFRMLKMQFSQFLKVTSIHAGNCL
jgi:hypothetical protein